MIITTRDRAHLLPRALDSVLNQTCQDYEIIIVDDGSTDGTKDLALGYSDHRVRYYRHEESKGVSAARNAGMSLALGEYITFLDDDDEMLPLRLEKSLDAISEDPEIEIVYGLAEEIDDTTGILVRYGMEITSSGEEAYRSLLKEQGLPSPLYKREICQDFDTNLSYGEDLHFIARIATPRNIKGIDHILTRVHVNHGLRQSGDSIDLDKLLTLHRTLLRDIPQMPRLSRYLRLFRCYTWYVSPFKHLRTTARRLRSRFLRFRYHPAGGHPPSH